MFFLKCLWTIKIYLNDVLRILQERCFMNETTFLILCLSLVSGDRRGSISSEIPDLPPPLPTSPLPTDEASTDNQSSPVRAEQKETYHINV